MSMENIKQSIEGAVEYLVANPQEARYTDSLATAVIENDLRCKVVDPDGRDVYTDMPASVGGEDSAPSPGWLLRAAMASCVSTLIAMRVAQLGLSARKIQTLVDSESNDYGILGIDDSIPAGPLTVRIQVNVQGEPGSEDEYRDAVTWAVDHCPVTDGIRREISIETMIEVSTAEA